MYVASFQIKVPTSANLQQKTITNPFISIHPLSASVVDSGEKVSGDELNDDDGSDDANNLRYTRFGGVGR